MSIGRDGDSLYREFKAKGAEITREPEVTFYEMKEFELKDSRDVSCPKQMR
jgi:uncharacterized glyoxalase superfamily protein PhnB